jgi:hypothetical protein
MSDEIAVGVEAEVSALDARMLARRRPSASEKKLGQARDVAAFVGLYYEPKGEGPTRVPGLKGAGLAAGTDRQILYLVDQIEQGNVGLTDDGPVFPIDHVREIAGDLRMYLDFAGRRDKELGARVKKLRRSLGRSRAPGAVVSGLSELCKLSDAHPAALGAIPDWTPALVEEGRALARRYHEALGSDTTDLKLRRRALAYLLQQRLDEVAAAAKLVFRRHPALLRQARGTARRPAARKAEPTP